MFKRKSYAELFFYKIHFFMILGPFSKRKTSKFKSLKEKPENRVDVTRPEGPIRVVVEICRIVGQLVRGTRVDRVMVVRVARAVPVQLDGTLEVGQRDEPAVVILRGRPNVRVDVRLDPELARQLDTKNFREI